MSLYSIITCIYCQLLGYIHDTQADNYHIIFNIYYIVKIDDHIHQHVFHHCAELRFSFIVRKDFWCTLA